MNRVQKNTTTSKTTGTGPRRAVVSPCERHVYIEVAKWAGHVPVQPVVDLLHVEPVEARQDSNPVSRLERAADSSSPDGAEVKTKTQNEPRGTRRQNNHRQMQ